MERIERMGGTPDDGMADAINIPGYGALPYIDKNPKNFFRRTTIAWGPSETGKSVVIRWIMEILQPYVPNVIVICPTDGANDGYRGIVPERCIYTRIDVKTLQDIWARQEEACATYNRANNLKVLRGLFVKANDITAMSMATHVERRCAAGLDALERDRTLVNALRKEQRQAIEKNRDSVLRRIYKKTIRSYREHLMRYRRELTKDELYAIKYIDFNPALLLVMDDCQAQIAEWIKDPTVRKLFYQIRHMWGTLLMSMQNDTGKPGLDPGIRTNVFNNFFTDPTVANRYFSNKDNGFTADDRKKAARIISELFKPNANGADNYKRFVYSRLDKRAKFRWCLPDDPENLRMCSPALWRLCESAPQERDTERNTKFSSSFAV
jgi:hypothetical protein